MSKTKVTLIGNVKLGYAYNKNFIEKNISKSK